MKTLIAYSSKTGSTKKIAEKLKEYANEAIMYDINQKDDITLADFEHIYVLGWIDKGTYNKEALDFANSISNKKVSFIFTLGAYPNSMHAYDCIENIKKVLVENNNEVISFWHCQGPIDPKLIEWMKNLDPSHGHAVDKSRELRWADAANHPNQEDYNSLFGFYSLTNKKLEN
ncbi:flavodoxin family protein [Mycoplasma sp. P36-A1]|uniref:flavodoxin family protein n=1 Tax=Mycoplasma sp. P36-A1 TaxID=3252900 RepID=UPI003C2B5C43